VIVDYDERRAAVAMTPLRPRSTHNVPLDSLGESKEHFPGARTTGPAAATNELQVELRIRAAEEECSYEFHLAPQLYDPKLASLWPPLDDPIRDPAVPAVRIAAPEAEYPETARRARIAGGVILEIVIEADGQVSGTRVLKPLPYGITNAAVAAVRAWRYKPAENHGQRVRSVQTVSVIFTPP
jgi:TonB family protein